MYRVSLLVGQSLILLLLLQAMVVVLAILDGWGIGKHYKGNAIAVARTPHLDTFFETCPWSFLKASGEDVGLPVGQMGNSEVGHLNIGAGRIVRQASAKIDTAIENKDFFNNRVLCQAITSASKKRLHLMGLLGPGGVHSYSRHLYALLHLAKIKGLKKSQVKIHCFLDGRDTPPMSAEKFLYELEDKITQLNMGSIATLVGRYYAMDRDNRWDRIKVAYDLLTKGKGYETSNPLEGLQDAYKRGETDEFVRPILIDKDGLIRSGDIVLFYNFRADRARQLTRSFIEHDFVYFKKDFLDITFVSMVPYQKDFSVPWVFRNDIPKNTLGEVLSHLSKRQLRIAETEKYAHVTFFFNGGRETPFKGEDRILVPSPPVSTYDKQPEMSAQRVMNETLNNLNNYDVIIVNFANADMVGHTGSLTAGIKAAETIDACIGKVAKGVENVEGTLLITSDHGDLEEMLDKKGHPHTTHTTNPVPCILMGRKNKKMRDGRLADVAPTLLDLLHLNKPQEMTGETLLVPL